MYTAAEDAAFNKDIQQAKPGMLEAAAASTAAAVQNWKRPTMLDYHRLATCRAADAVVEAAAAEAAKQAYQASLTDRHAWRQKKTGKYVAFVSVEIQAHGRLVSRNYNSALKAACAADLMKLALGRQRRLNLPRNFIQWPDWVAAMDAFVQLEVQRKQKQLAGMSVAGQQ